MSDLYRRNVSGTTVWHAKLWIGGEAADPFYRDFIEAPGTAARKADAMRLVRP